MTRILVTGGAGFIGSHLVDELLENKSNYVTILDSLEPQVHGKNGVFPLYLNEQANLIKGSVTDYQKLKELVKENDIIIHLAAIVGVGQSMYQIRKYVYNNILGTSNLLEILANKEHSIKKVIIASSNTVYGEGKSNCDNCGIRYPSLRKEDQLTKKNWENYCPNCDLKLTPLLTDENTPFNSSSIYALTKQSQEESAMLIGKTFGINTTVLRFFLVYGTRQALTNPYTGVCAIFSVRLFNNKPVIVFEDGLQTRDFIHVKDICRAIILAMEDTAANYQIFNVGTGKPITIKEVAEIITEKINPNLKPIFNQQYRIGDIRHCVADISKIKSKLNFNPTINFQDGIDDLIEWIKPQIGKVKDSSQAALDELNSKGLIK